MMNHNWTYLLIPGGIVFGIVVLFPWAVIIVGRYFHWVAEHYGN